VYPYPVGIPAKLVSFFVSSFEFPCPACIRSFLHETFLITYWSQLYGTYIILMHVWLCVRTFLLDNHPRL
jgi:hypothetical protein